MGAVGRGDELRAIARFLAADWPDILVLAGEPGIGKTTLWRYAVEQATDQGIRVLSCQPSAAETQLSCASLADLLADVEPRVLAELPQPQREALDIVLLRQPQFGQATDQRATAAAVVTILTRLAEDGPVLVAIDDAQWLDSSSAQVVAFAMRRLCGPVGVLATVRTDEPTWESHRMPIGPLPMHGLHELLRARTGRSFPRPTMARIHQVSGGNPFYALELARTDTATELPPTLAQLVRARIDGIKPDVRHALLVAAALAGPTVELIEAAVDATPAALDGLLEDAEQWDVIRLDGNRVRFTHPLLATGIYTAASPAGRRSVHRRLADVVTDPEERARHLALAAIRLDRATVAALDDAAVLARARGATAAAAELLELAIKLGADTPERRNRLAQHHFDAGDPVRARALLEGTTTAEGLRLLAMMRLHDDSYHDAAAYLVRALESATGELRVRIEIDLLYVLFNLGRMGEALARIDETLADSTALGDDELTVLANGMVTIIRFLGGQGVSDETISQILDLPDPVTPAPVVLRPSLIGGLLLSWTGRLDEAHDRMLALRRRCLDRGEESDLMITAFHTVITECWRGNLADARLLAEDTMARAEQLGTVLPHATALLTQAHVAVYTGDVAEAREAAEEALAIFQRGSCVAITVWPMVTLGFLHISQGDHEAAAAVLGPLVDTGYHEPRTTPFAPDAVEALLGVGRLADAEAVINRIPDDNRPWSRAIAARCRSLLLAAQGDLEGAAEAATEALTAHNLLPMPFERARTLLVLGQVQRRRRRRAAAATALTEAARIFTDLGTPLWTARAQADLARTTVPVGDGMALTPSERRVAELAAGGMTNRQVAGTLFISTRTVEVNLSRVYRKLGIRSRAELGRRMVDGVI
ncbi:MAG TPA: LuxR family transcriptional regulator [Pseudonocardiaceae bacterium]|nr:LuxR family transcriptional regulator [Pseudonocardiaceae bacterium]